MFNREAAVRLLLRRPGTLEPRTVRWTVLVLTGIGAGFLIWSAVIRLELWAAGYKDISVIGPLFLAQGITSIIFALAIAVFRWLALLAAGALAGLATAVGLLLSVYVGLFGYTESLSVPYAVLSLAVGFTAAFVLLVGAALLALTPQVRSDRPDRRLGMRFTVTR
jgi:hypothetical protein